MGWRSQQSNDSFDGEASLASPLGYGLLCTILLVLSKLSSYHQKLACLGWADELVIKCAHSLRLPIFGLVHVGACSCTNHGSTAGCSHCINPLPFLLEGLSKVVPTCINSN